MINGKQIKSKNEYFNMKKAELQSQLLKGKYTSKRIQSLLQKRENILNDFMHKASTFIIKYCLENNINTIIIGSNKNWKQNCNLGHNTNRKFIQIPYDSFKRKLEYKCKLNGISYIETEESYTSKIDHLAFEEMKHQPKYLGKRIHRGLFQSSTGKLLNADINGSIGIMRKVLESKISQEWIKSLLNNGLVAKPLKVNSFIK